jgi:hypothetical protein
MVYSQIDIGNLNNQIESNNSILAQETNRTPRVVVEFRGTGIHTIAGPVPFVDISTSVSINDNNLPELTTTKITLTGKIFKFSPPLHTNPNQPSVGGFRELINGINDIKKLFTDCEIGKLDIKCDNNILYSATGLSLSDISFDKTDDNWVQSVDYSVSLQRIDNLFAKTEAEKYVKDRQDSWSIEPIEDTVYTEYVLNRITKYEYSNPKLHPNRNNIGQTNQIIEPYDLVVKNVPQYRITRRLSAKGLPQGNPDPLRCQEVSEQNKAYVFAKNWVEQQSSGLFKAAMTPNDSTPYFNNPFIANKLFAFNHNRTINIDIFNGTYETNDSWLAMPSGIPYTETYTIETSTNDEYIKTARVQGNIVGLAITDIGIMQTGGMLPVGTGTDGVIDAGINLSSFNKPGISNNTNYPNLDSNNTTNPSNNNIENNRYSNALQAWTNHIKPFLYRRASIAINSPDRTLSYVPQNRTNPPRPPNNPIYSKETLLSLIPISTSEGHDPRKGTISYSYEYNNRLNIISGVINENINISYTNPTDNTAETPVIGRALGPIIQRTSRTTPKKTISVEVSVPPATGIDAMSLDQPKCALHRSQSIFQNIEKLIESQRPYSPSTFLPGENIQTEGLVYSSDDSEQWNPTTGKYSRTVSWIYQQANIGRDHRDH